GGLGSGSGRRISVGLPRGGASPRRRGPRTEPPRRPGRSRLRRARRRGRRHGRGVPSGTALGGRRLDRCRGRTACRRRQARHPGLTIAAGDRHLDGRWGAMSGAKSAAKVRIRSPALGSIPHDVFLRSLTLRGFKSFADRTVLEFAPGVSVIVGPNGSGKSNIADAISWVLGEQGVRALRGAQMADVIFAGSPSRAGIGMAEVTLVIDHSAGYIKVPAAEIEISRSILRSGESEYRLSGRPCRLIDIQEMLSDAGLGRAQHAVVGQGQLEDVLTARPEERR